MLTGAAAFFSTLPAPLSVLAFFFFGDTGDPSLAPPTPLYRCSESALPEELLEVWLLTEEILLALEEREDPDEEDLLLDRDPLLLLRPLPCLPGLGGCPNLWGGCCWDGGPALFLGPLPRMGS